MLGTLDFTGSEPWAPFNVLQCTALNGYFERLFSHMHTNGIFIVP